jgi:hypothetical protein
MELFNGIILFYRLEQKPIISEGPGRGEESENTQAR